MSVTEQYVAAMRLVSQAEATYRQLKQASRDALDAGDSVRFQRLYHIRRKAIVRYYRRNEAYERLVHGKVQP